MGKRKRKRRRSGSEARRGRGSESPRVRTLGAAAVELRALEPEASARVAPFASAATLRLVEPSPSPSTPIPRRWRAALFTSAGIAVVSTTLAIMMALRPDDPATERIVVVKPEPTRPETAAPLDADLVAVPTPTPEANPANPAAAAASALPWPDTQLRVLPAVGSAPPAMGQSAGSPRDGVLLRATRLPRDRSYTILDPETAWGTDNTIQRLREAITTMRAKHPGQSPLLIGDISTARGGPLTGHQSHQAGRDADVGLLYRQQPQDAPEGFVEGTRKNLDLHATYALVAALAASAGEPGGVTLIVLDYNLQRLLRRAAEARGVPAAELDALFQFPRGPSSREGLVRHMPAHRDHLHVRFSCPAGDDYCRDPLIGFGGMEAIEGRTSPPGI